MLDYLKNTLKPSTYKVVNNMSIKNDVEKLIAIYFNGKNYVYDGIEFNREESRIMVKELIHLLEIIELIEERHKRK